MGNLKDRHINALFKGYDYGSRVRWWYEKGDIYKYMQAINSPSGYSWISKFIPEMRLRELEHHLTARGQHYFSTEEGQVELDLLMNFLRRYGDGQRFAELEKRRQREASSFNAELANIRNRINDGEVINLDNFIDRNPHLYDDPLLLWPDMKEKERNRRFAMNAMGYFGEKWRSRFSLFPIMLRAIQYQNREAVARLFAQKKLPRNDEMISVIWITLMQIARAEIHPDSLGVVAYLTKRCIVPWCVEKRPINPFRDEGGVGEEGWGTIADAWYALAQDFYIEPSDASDNDASGVKAYTREVAGVAQDVLATLIKVRRP